MTDELGVAIAAVAAVVAILTAVAQARAFGARRHLRESTEAASVLRDLQDASDSHDPELVVHLQGLVRYHAAAYVRQHRLTIVDPVNAFFETLFGVGVIVAGTRILFERPDVHTADMLFGRYLGLGFVIAGAIYACAGIVHWVRLRRDRAIRKAAGLPLDEHQPRHVNTSPRAGHRLRWAAGGEIVAGIAVAVAVTVCVFAVATASLRGESVDATARFAAAIPTIGGFIALVLSKRSRWTWIAAALGAAALIPVIVPLTPVGVLLSALLGAGAVVALIVDTRAAARHAGRQVGDARNPTAARSEGAPQHHGEPLREGQERRPRDERESAPHCSADAARTRRSSSALGG
jgi:hypothetical protein